MCSAKRSCILLLAVMFSCMMVLPAMAQLSAGFDAPVILKWDAQNQQNIAASSVDQDDIVTVNIRLNKTAKNVGGIDLSLIYDPSVMEHDENAAKCLIIDSKGKEVISADKSKGIIRANWDTTSKNTDISGTIFSFRFRLRPVGTGGTTLFKLDIKEMFDSSSSQSDFSVSIPNKESSVEVLALSIPTDAVNKIKKLSDIKYPDSLSDIVEAENAFNAFTSSQKTAFHKQYPNLYAQLAGARNVYYKLAEKAAKEEVEKEVNGFYTRNDKALKLTVDTVKISNEAEVLKAAQELETLSPMAFSRVPAKDKNLLSGLLNKINKLKKDAQAEQEAEQEAKEAADEYKKQYNILWNLTDNILEREYEEFQATIDEAVFMYDLLPAKAKDYVKSEKSILDNLTKKIEKLIASDKAEQKLREEVNNYQYKWISVFRITEDTVGIKDKTAIQLALEDYNNLSTQAKNRLKNRKEDMEKLLLIIEQLEELAKEKPKPEKPITPGIVAPPSVTPQPDPIIHPITPQPEYPQIIDPNVDGDTGHNDDNNSAETNYDSPQPSVKEVVKVVDNEKILYKDRGISKAIIILFDRL